MYNLYVDEKLSRYAHVRNKEDIYETWLYND